MTAQFVARRLEEITMPDRSHPSCPLSSQPCAALAAPILACTALIGCATPPDEITGSSDEQGVVAQALGVNGTGGPYSSVTRAGTVRLDYIQSNAHVLESYLPMSGTWHQFDLWTQITSPDAIGRVTSVESANGPLRIAYLASDQHIHEARLTPQGWFPDDLSARTGAPAAAGSPVGVVDLGGTTRFHYLGADGHIHEIFSTGPESWAHGDLSRAAGATDIAAVSDPSDVISVDGTLRVVYRGSDSHIHELFLTPEIGWAHFDLTRATGAAPAATAISGVLDGAHGTRLHYVGNDGGVHELQLAPGFNWRYGNLSAATGAPAATAQVHDLVSPDGTVRIDYVAIAGHVVELSLAPCAGCSWAFYDLTLNTGATPATGTPSGVVDLAGVTRVHYRATSGAIGEIYLPPGDGWHFFLLPE